ncbi:MAG: hypothetical protein ABIT16_09980 [Croceibacterium sp.]
MKFAALTATAAIALVGTTAPALAQDAAATAAATAPAAAVAVGTKVYGPNGGEVGMISEVLGDAVVLNTGTIEAALPKSAFGTSPQGPTISWDKAEFEAAVTQANQEAAAAFEAALVAGADVYSSDNILLGKVQSVGEDGQIVVALESGAVTVGKEQLALTANKLTFLATAADVEAAVSAQAGG